MKTLNPIEGIINQTVKLYFDLCQIADSVYKIGTNSGAKRTILLYVGQRGEVPPADLAAEFPDPANIAKWRETLMDLVKIGLISLEVRSGQTILMLTAAGKLKVQEIITFEAGLTKYLPAEITIADLRKATLLMEQMGEGLADLRVSAPAVKTSKVAS